MEDSETPRPTNPRRRFGKKIRRPRVEASAPQEQTAAAMDWPPPKIISTKSDADTRPRIEIAVERITLVVDGEPTPEYFRVLAEMVKGPRPSASPEVTGSVGTGELAEQQVTNEASGNQLRAEPGDTASVAIRRKGKPRDSARLKRVGAAAFGTAKDIITELIARLSGHWLGFPS